MPIAPHEFWQTIHPPAKFPTGPENGFIDAFPATLADGRQILLPIRILPGAGDRAVASLIVNQASFEVEDALSDAMTTCARQFEPGVIIAVPTLGLPLANGVARRLGHTRMAALGTSRKFWYDDALSEPLSSITSPAAAKRLYLDPRLLPMLQDRRVVVVDDVISSGASITAVLRLLAKAGVRPVAAIFAMLQTERWKAALASEKFDLPIEGAMSSPLLMKGLDGQWRRVPPGHGMAQTA